MCTVTVTSHSGNTLVTMNRDEAPERAEAPPRLWSNGARLFVAPADLRAGGAWIGANENGLIACLLNRYEHAPEAPKSRGAIVPAAMNSATAREAHAAMRDLPLAQFAAFTLLLISRSEILRLDWTGAAFTSAPLDNQAPLMVTSSLWRGAEAIAHREAAFRGALADGASRTAIERFHCAPDAAQPELSAMMRRDHSRTRSIVQVEIETDRAVMAYWTRESALARGLSRPDAQIALDLRIA